MKYKVEWVEVKTSQKTGKNYVVMSLTDEQGKESKNVSCFDEGLQAGMEIEGEVIQNGNFLNFKSRQQVAKTNFSSKAKEESIAKFQENKTQQIEKAQDRSAWMWAKTNASTLLAGREDNFLNKDNDFIAGEVLDLATKIYNGELQVPF